MNTKISYKEFQDALAIVNQYKDQLETHYKQVEEQTKNINPFLGTSKQTPLTEVKGLSVRTKNGLLSRFDYDFGSSRKDVSVNHLEGLSIKEDLKPVRNLGEESIKEIKELCFYTGINLKP